MVTGKILGYVTLEATCTLSTVMALTHQYVEEVQ